MRHLFQCFWRPDILARMQAQNQTQIAICDLLVSTRDMTATLSETDCPACRETFLNALPSGSGKRLTFAEYLEQQATEVRRRDAERARGGWSTKPTPAPASGWTTTAKPASSGWSTQR